MRDAASGSDIDGNSSADGAQTHRSNILTRLCRACDWLGATSLPAISCYCLPVCARRPFSPLNEPYGGLLIGADEANAFRWNFLVVVVVWFVVVVVAVRFNKNGRASNCTDDCQSLCRHQLFR